MRFVTTPGKSSFAAGMRLMVTSPSSAGSSPQALALTLISAINAGIKNLLFI